MTEGSRPGRANGQSAEKATRDLAAAGLQGLLARPVAVAIFVITLVVLGFFSLLRLPVALLPALERPRIEITLEARELERRQWLEEMIEPLERRLAPLPGVANISSHIDDGRVRLELEGEWQADPDRLLVEVERVLAAFPAGRLEAALTRAAPPDARPVLRLAILPRPGTPADLLAITTFVDSVLLPELGHLPGVGELRRRGGVRQEIRIEPRFAELAARSLPVSALADRLRGSGTSTPLGEVRHGGDRHTLRLGRQIESLESLATLSLGDGLVLADVADLRRIEEPEGSLVFVGPQPAVVVDVFRARGANAVLLAQKTHALLAELEKGPGQHPALVVLDDTSTEVVGSLGGLGSSLLLGLVLGAALLRLGLGRLRPTLALIVVVPCSILASFAAFFVFGVPLDVVSLAGLALASGMLVDSSVVVLEAIATARTEGASDPRLKGTRQVAMPLFASFLTTAVVFLPLLYLEGMARAFFGAQAFAIAASLGLSLIFSLTLTPLLCGRLDRLDLGEGGTHFGAASYRRRLHQELGRPARVLLTALVLTGLGAALVWVLPKTLMPEGLRRHLHIALVTDAATPEEAKTKLAAIAAGIAAATPDQLFEAELVVPGPARSALSRRSFLEEGRGRVLISFPDPETLEKAEPGIGAALAAIPGTVATARRERGALAAFADELGAGLELRVLAADDNRSAALAATLTAKLQTASFGVRPALFAARRAVELHFEHLRGPEARAAAENELRALLGGESLGQIHLLGLAGELRLQPSPGSPLELLPVPLPVVSTEKDPDAEGKSQRLVPLSALARLAEKEREPPLERTGGRASRHLRVDAPLAQRAAVEALIAELPLAAGEEIALVGQTGELAKTFGELELALSLGLLLVFLSIAALYESLRLALVVMATVPAALGGAFFALVIAGSTLDVFSFLGLLLIAGIVVNNAIVLIDRAEARRAAGQATDEAILGAAGDRYRPILMTTATTLLGLLPMALLGGEGAELRRSLALALAGGLATSWLAVLFVLPALYLLVFARQHVAESRPPAGQDR